MSQLDLFSGAAGVQPVRDAALDALRARLPSRLYLGTCSWTYPGWADTVWAGRPSHAELVKRGLFAYARFPLFSTVEIDRSYYGPLTPADQQSYAEQLPPAFVLVAKLWLELTTPVFADHPRWGARAGQRNPRFFDPELGAEVVRSYLDGPLAEHTGPLLLCVPPLSSAHRPDAQRFCAALERLLGALPPHRYAVEVRNRELRVPRLGALLVEHGASLVLNWWSGMPELTQQRREMPRFLFQVVRLLLPPASAYEARRDELTPFDRVRSPQPVMRAEVVELLRESLPERDVYVLADNKAEGSAPGTLRAIAEAFVNDGVRG